MAELTWGLIAKSVEDKTTIDEEIDAKISTHTLDPSAHGQTNEALWAHREQEIIDHIDGSIGLQKWVNTKNIIYTVFESLDLWIEKLRTELSVIGQLEIYTGTTLNNLAYCVADVPVMSTFPLFEKNTFFQTACYINNTASGFAYVGAGEAQATENSEFFGFKFKDNKVYACIRQNIEPNVTEYTTEIVGVAHDSLHIYKVQCDWENQEIRFYIDGVLVYTYTTHLPTDFFDRMFSYYAKNTGSTDLIVISNYLMLQADL